MTEENNQQPRKELGPLDIMKSVAAAMIGVQSDDNRERDFEQGKPAHFIIAGVIFVIIFLLTIATVVSSVLKSAGQ
ncbi:MAG: hypothetical protein COA74_06035 [Gammaproteobacteria bacterium]|nr:MAG: hypothetical protein COA74_06035 [Gammaproteobacteria bacterium]